MPIFEYQCKECGFVEDQLLRGRDIPRTWVCPKCEGVMMRKIGLSSPHFKGSGFYCSRNDGGDSE